LNLNVLIDKGKEDPTFYFADQMKVKYDPIRKPFFSLGIRLCIFVLTMPT